MGRRLTPPPRFKSCQHNCHGHDLCGRWTVPSYLLHCRGCLKPFTKQSSRHDYEQGDIVCPFCGSSDVERQVSRSTTPLQRGAIDADETGPRVKLAVSWRKSFMHSKEDHVSRKFELKGPPTHLHHHPLSSGEGVRWTCSQCGWESAPMYFGEVFEPTECRMLNMSVTSRNFL
jgi:ssDNA-binding Zn-finger/Zn-ribbon topoisomerase 1